MTQTNEQIWNLLVSLSNDPDFEHCDPEYKQELIDGYKICQGKTYNFKTIEEEEAYFMRDDITAAEEVYYYTFIIQWGPVTDLSNKSIIHYLLYDIPKYLNTYIPIYLYTYIPIYLYTYIPYTAYTVSTVLFITVSFTIFFIIFV